MSAETDSRIFPDIYAAENIPTLLDVTHTFCDDYWFVEDSGNVEILGLPVEYDLVGDGYLNFDDPNTDLTTDLVITIPQLGCQFDVDDIPMTGTQNPDSTFVSVAGDKYIPNITACGARWEVDATLRIRGFLE